MYTNKTATVLSVMKTVLVTGVSRGMGMATAKTLSKEGYRVIGIYNANQESAERLKKEFENVEIFACDFSKREQTLTLVDTLKYYSFCGIANCAGVFLGIDFQQFDMEIWRQTFEVNVHAPLLLVQGLKGNIEDGGSIVNIASTDGMVGSEVGLAYSASKAALINLTMSLANVFGSRGIRVNAVAPGWIGDGMQSPQELLDEAKWFNPLRRLGSYEEMARVVSFLLSDKSSYINGTTLVADGGDSAVNYVLRKETDMRRAV